MDWKSYYQNELMSAEGQVFVQRCFERHPKGDPRIARILKNQGIISFPHTSIYYAGEGLARLVITLYRRKIEKIIALGVLHGAKLPGAFIQTDSIETPFGVVPLYSPDGLMAKVVRENEPLLAGEFSLDNFLKLMALYAREARVDPIPVLPLYIGITRDPGGSFATAAEIAQQLRRIVDDRAALVATGDLVHYGMAYSMPEEMADKPIETLDLEAYFRGRVCAALDSACHDGDYARFFEISSGELKNDQRQILPVICAYFEEGVNYEILSFELSDYSRILNVKPPCLVASSLTGFRAVEASPS